MLDVAESGRTLSKEQYDAVLPGLRAAMLEQVKGHSALLIQSNHFAIHKGIFGKRRTGSRQAGKVLIE